MAMRPLQTRVPMPESDNDSGLIFDDDCMYGECYLVPFSTVYDEIHIPLSICICIFGSVSNIFNIIVLTRKRMRTPINLLLSGLSIAQWLLAANYLGLLTVEFFRHKCYQLPWTKTLTWYRLINVNLNVVFHTVAFMHTIIVAVFRYCALKYPLQANRYLYKSELAVLTTLVIWLIVPIICIPIFFTSQVAKLGIDEVANVGCAFEEDMYDLNYTSQPTLVSAVFWMFGIVMKLIPSALLTILLSALIRSLKSVEKRRNVWYAKGVGKNSSLSTTTVVKKPQRRFTSRPRTTRMLVTILFLCVAVELPHGCLNLLVAVYGESFGIRIYDHLGSFMEMLTLLYSSISFILYCTMSNDFLRTFRSLFCLVCGGDNSVNAGEASYFGAISAAATSTWRKSKTRLLNRRGSLNGHTECGVAEADDNAETNSVSASNPPVDTLVVTYVPRRCLKTLRLLSLM